MRMYAICPVPNYFDEPLNPVTIATSQATNGSNRGLEVGHVHTASTRPGENLDLRFQYPRLNLEVVDPSPDGVAPAHGQSLPVTENNGCEYLGTAPGEVSE